MKLIGFIEQKVNTDNEFQSNQLSILHLRRTYRIDSSVIMIYTFQDTSTN